jgi:hypothetical protein
MKASSFLILCFILLLSTDEQTQGQCKNKPKLPKLSDYSAQHYDGNVHAPMLESKHHRMFRTAIREAAKNGVNFAGHYVIADWGCGTGCTQFVVQDALTGTVVDPPFQWVEFHYWGFLSKIPKWAAYEPRWTCFDGFLTYRRDSSLLVVEGCISKRQCGRTFYEMKYGHLSQVMFDPDLLPNGTVAPIGP